MTVAEKILPSLADDAAPLPNALRALHSLNSGLVILTSDRLVERLMATPPLSQGHLEERGVSDHILPGDRGVARQWCSKMLQVRSQIVLLRNGGGTAAQFVEIATALAMVGHLVLIVVEAERNDERSVAERFEDFCNQVDPDTAVMTRAAFKGFMGGDGVLDELAQPPDFEPMP